MWSDVPHEDVRRRAGPRHPSDRRRPALRALAGPVGVDGGHRPRHHDAAGRARAGRPRSRPPSLSEKLRDAGGSLDDLPLVGDGIATPFDEAADASDGIAAAGRAQVEAVEDLAFWLGLAVGAIPILVVAAFYLPLRWRFIRRASAGQRYVDAVEDLDLFALRALARQPMHVLAKISDDPAGAWRRRDPVITRTLAELELRASGLRPPRVPGIVATMSKARSRLIVETLQEAFAPLMKADPRGFRGKFRKMASDPHAFYRGSACLFYADVTDERGPVRDRGQRPHLDPRRPARRELRHLPQRRRAAGLRRQRLRRGLPRALHLGPPAVRRLAGAGRLAEGAAGGVGAPADRLATRGPTSARSTTTGAPTTTPTTSRSTSRTPRGRSTPRSRSARLQRRADLLDELTVVQRGVRDVRRRRHPAQAPGPGEEGRRGGLRGLPGDDPRRQAVRPGPLLRPARRGRQVRASGSAAPACRRTTCWSRATARPSTTTWCCR